MNTVQTTGFNYAPFTADSVLSEYREGAPYRGIVRATHRIFTNQTGFGVYKVEDGKAKQFSISGSFPTPLSINAYYEIEGKVGRFRGEKQVTVSSYRSATPKNAEGIINVLKTLPGLSERAHSLYTYFGSKVLDIIKKDPERVAEIRGISLKRAKSWQAHLIKHEAFDEALMMLSELGLSAEKSKKLIDLYGTEVHDVVKLNPFVLMKTVGFSFTQCDAIHEKVGRPLDDLDRIYHAFIHVLKAESYEGHCYMNEPELFAEVDRIVAFRLNYRTASAFLNATATKAHFRGKSYAIDRTSLSQALRNTYEKQGSYRNFSYLVASVPKKHLEQALSLLLQSSAIIKDSTQTGICYALGYIYAAEESIAAAVRNFNRAKKLLPNTIDVIQIAKSICHKKKAILEKKQWEGVISFAQETGGIYILNGKAGSGKTFTLNIALATMKEVYEARGRRFSARLMAPTGVAAKVAHNATGLDTSTIHKALGLMGSDDNEEGYGESSRASINCDCVVVDETSMTDIFLMSQLFSAISPSTKVILLGDIEQLPSIGPGAVLKDLIESGIVTTITLDVVKRQTEASGVLKNANKIIDGEYIASEVVNEGQFASNAFIIPESSPLACRSKIIATMQEALQDYKIEDVQVLCPQKKTDIGIFALNLFIQKAINPIAEGEPTVKAMTVTYKDECGESHEEVLRYHRGDKVLHIVNNRNIAWYKKDSILGFSQDHTKSGIVNGECGVIEEVTTRVVDGKSLPAIIVKYDDGYVVYVSDFSELQHSFAMTVHKSQGSQWPVVIAPIMNINRIMLNRSLFYTLYTRAQDCNFVIGTDDAIRYAIDNVDPKRRRTHLQEKLRMKEPPAVVDVSLAMKPPKESKKEIKMPF